MENWFPLCKGSEGMLRSCWQEHNLRLQMSRPVTQLPLLHTGKIFARIIYRSKAVSASTCSEPMGYILSSQTAENALEKGLFKARHTVIQSFKKQYLQTGELAFILLLKAAVRLALTTERWSKSMTGLPVSPQNLWGLACRHCVSQPDSPQGQDGDIRTWWGQAARRRAGAVSITQGASRPHCPQGHRAVKWQRKRHTTSGDRNW